MGCATGSRMLRMTSTGSGYGVQPPRLTQGHWRITRQAQPGDTTSTWNPLSHNNSKIQQFCLVLSSTLLATEPAFSASITICLESKFSSCQSSRELWVTPRDGCCGTSLEIKGTDGSDRLSTSPAALSHFRYDPSGLRNAYLRPRKTLWVCNLKALCNCLIKLTLKYICRGFFEEICLKYVFFVEFTSPPPKKKTPPL